MNTKLTNRLFTAAAMALALTLLWLCLEAWNQPKAGELRLYVVPVVPTVPGIEAAPSPAPFYRRPVVVRSGPSAGIYDVEEAPANGCARPAFEVISGRQSDRGCRGAQ